MISQKCLNIACQPIVFIFQNSKYAMSFTLKQLNDNGLLNIPVTFKLLGNPRFDGTINNVDVPILKKFNEYSIDIENYTGKYYEIKNTSFKVVGFLYCSKIDASRLTLNGGAKQKRHASRWHWESTGNHVDVKVRGKDGKLKVVQRMVYVNAKYPGQMRIAKIKDGKRVYVAFRSV